MLQVPSKETNRLLELADFMDQLAPEKFSLRSWGSTSEPRCICGWFMHNHARADKSNWVDAARMLGIDERSAAQMFSQHISDVTNKDAARALRHYAVTGEFAGW